MKNMDKKIGLIFISFVIIISAISLVSAAYYGTFTAGELRQASETIIQWIKDILGPFFEFILGTSSYDSFFYTKVLLLILIFAMIHFSLSNVELFQDRNSVLIIVSSIVSIFAVRYLQEGDFISGILLPTGALGIAFIVLLPVIIFFLFIHRSMRNSAVGRRIAWIFFFIVFFVIWLKRRTELPSELNWIYFLGMILVGINVLFDSQIHHYFDMQGLARWRSQVHDAEIVRMQEEFQRIANVDTPEARRRRNYLHRRINRLGGNVRANYNI
jgi:hypothetical protein